MDQLFGFGERLSLFLAVSSQATYLRVILVFMSVDEHGGAMLRKRSGEASPTLQPAKFFPDDDDFEGPESLWRWLEERRADSFRRDRVPSRGEQPLINRNARCTNAGERNLLSPGRRASSPYGSPYNHVPQITDVPGRFFRVRTTFYSPNTGNSCLAACRWDFCAVDSDLLLCAGHVACRIGTLCGAACQ